MCGLVGVFGDFGKKKEILFKDMLLCDMLRGYDGTGICIGGGGKQVVYKKAMMAFDYLNLKTTDKLLSAAGARYALGHNRAASNKANIKDSTSHPFEGETWIVFHNGFISNSHKLATDLCAKIEVDSEIILELFEAGLTPKEVGETLEGSFCVVALNKKTEELFIFRNKERPLSYVEADDSFIYASEGGMLEWLVERTLSNKIGDVKELAVGTVLKGTLKANGWFGGIELSSFTPKKIEAVTYGNYSTSNWGRTTAGKETRDFVISKIIPSVHNSQQCDVEGVTASGTPVLMYWVKMTALDFADIKVGTMVTGTVTFTRPGGEVIVDGSSLTVREAKALPAPSIIVPPQKKERKKRGTLQRNGAKEELSIRSEYYKSISCGCYSCGVKPRWEKKDEILWIDENMFLCPSCAESETVLNNFVM